MVHPDGMRTFTHDKEELEEIPDYSLELLAHVQPVELTDTGSGTQEGIKYEVPSTTPSLMEDPCASIKNISHHEASKTVGGAFTFLLLQETPTM